MARILIADDLEQNRYMLEALLTGNGHEVVSAINGEEALRFAKSAPVDLVVSDILMPVMDGFTFCREWRGDENLKSIPFIFYTATYTDRKDVDFGLSLGADLYLVKPMDPVELMTNIGALLDRRTAGHSPNSEPPGESIYLQEYNQALIRKLESKMLQLEAEVQVRRRTEAQLLRFKTAMDNSDDSIVLTDARGMIEYVNPAFERTTGLTREETVGRSPDFLETWGGARGVLESMWNTIKKGETWRRHLTEKNKEGKVVELEATVSPIPGERGDIEGYVSVMRDVTQQMAMEMKLVQSQKMEAIGTLAGGIAHDFNNILGVIMGYTQLASFADSLEKKTLNHLNSALEACDRAKHLIDQILTFCRKTERKEVLVDLVALIEESRTFLRASIPSTIEIRANLETKVGYILADPTQIQQVILNLCTNAVYAMRESGGNLDIKLRRIELDNITSKFNPELHPGPYLLLSINDTGGGIDKDLLPKIFEPFFTTKERGEGTGLGLSVVHGIVQGHKGAISVYSEPGHGTTFDVYFPEAQGVTSVEDDLNPAQLPTGSENILYVDDEQELVDIGSQMLEKLGYRVTKALSGNEALSIFRQNRQPFDMIITDQTMPGMTGMELATELLNRSPDIPIIVCTGFTTFDAEKKADAIGVKQLMSKPFDFRDLAFTVRKILDRRTPKLP